MGSWDEMADDTNWSGLTFDTTPAWWSFDGDDVGEVEIMARKLNQRRSLDLIYHHYYHVYLLFWLVFVCAR